MENTIDITTLTLVELKDLEKVVREELKTRRSN